MELTAAGRVFLGEARTVPAALDAGVSKALRTSRALTGRLRLGFLPGAALELTAPILAAFREQYPDVMLELRESTVADLYCGLRSGAADVPSCDCRWTPPGWRPRPSSPSPSWPWCPTTTGWQAAPR